MSNLSFVKSKCRVVEVNDIKEIEDNRYFKNEICLYDGKFYYLGCEIDKKVIETLKKQYKIVDLKEECGVIVDIYAALKSICRLDYTIEESKWVLNEKGYQKFIEMYYWDPLVIALMTYNKVNDIFYYWTQSSDIAMLKEQQFWEHLIYAKNDKFFITPKGIDKLIKIYVNMSQNYNKGRINRETMAYYFEKYIEFLNNANFTKSLVKSPVETMKLRKLSSRLQKVLDEEREKDKIYLQKCEEQKKLLSLKSNNEINR